MKRISAVCILLIFLLGVSLFWTSAAGDNGIQAVITALYSLRSGLSALMEEENAAFERCREAITAVNPGETKLSANTEQLISSLDDQLRDASIPKTQKEKLEDTVNQLRNTYRTEIQTNRRLIFLYQQMEQEWALFLDRFSQLSERVEELPAQLGKALNIN